MTVIQDAQRTPVTIRDRGQDLHIAAVCAHKRPHALPVGPRAQNGSPTPTNRSARPHDKPYERCHGHRETRTKAGHTLTSPTRPTKTARAATLTRAAVISTVAALAAGAIVAASGGAQGTTTPATTKLELVAKDGSWKYVDHPPRARGDNAGAGDQIMQSAPILTKDGARKGTFDATCTCTTGGRTGHVVCHGTYALTNGDVHIMARVSNSNNDRRVSGSVVGGTRAYAGAHGTFTSIDRPGDQRGNPRDETITLLP